MLNVKHPSDSPLKRFFRAVFSYKHIFRLIPLIVFFAVPFVIGSRYYKKTLLNFLNRNIHQNVSYSDVHLVLLPAPGLELVNVEIFENFAASAPVIKTGRLYIQLTWKTLMLKEIVIRKANFYEAQFTVYRTDHLNHTIRDPVIKRQSSEPGNFRSQGILEKYPFLKRLSSMEISSLHLFNSEILYRDLPNQSAYRLKLASLSAVHLDKSVYEITWNGLFNGSPLSGAAVLSLHHEGTKPGNHDFQITIRTDNFPLRVFRYITDSFYLADYSNAGFSGTVTIAKKGRLPVNVQLSGSLTGLMLKKMVSFPSISIRGFFDYYADLKSVRIRSVDIEWPGNSKVTGYGSINWFRTLDIDLKLNSPYSDYASVLNFLELIRVPYKDTPAAYGLKQYLLTMHKVNYYGHIFDEVNAFITYRNRILEIPVFESQLYGGILSGKARADYRDYSFYAEGEIAGSDIYKILKVYMPEPYLTGEVWGKFRLKSNVKSMDSLLQNLSMHGNLLIRNGELLGYLDIIRPVASVGKVLNITGPYGKSTAFEKITLNYRIRDGAAEIRSLSMKGVGISAKGEGVVFFDSRIDMQLIISMGGSIWGHILKIPVIYDGKIGESLPYVDPIWIMSVSAGGILTAPAAASPWSGVIAGSLASEYIRDGYNFIKKIFRSGNPDSGKPSDDWDFQIPDDPDFPVTEK